MPTRYYVPEQFWAYSYCCGWAWPNSENESLAKWLDVQKYSRAAASGGARSGQWLTWRWSDQTRRLMRIHLCGEESSTCTSARRLHCTPSSPLIKCIYPTRQNTMASLSAQLESDGPPLAVSIVCQPSRRRTNTRFRVRTFISVPSRERVYTCTANSSYWPSCARKTLVSISATDRWCWPIVQRSHRWDTRFERWFQLLDNKSKKTSSGIFFYDNIYNKVFSNRARRPLVLDWISVLQKCNDQF